MSELWVDVPGYNSDIQVSNVSRVRRLKLFGWSYYTPSLDTNGYFTVNLTYRGNRKTWKVHALMALCFIGARPKDYDIHHKDGVKVHNYIDNLEYKTRSENVEHAWNTGLIRRRMFTLEEISDIKNFRANGMINENIGKIYGVSGGTISRLSNNRRNFLKEIPKKIS